MACLHDRVNNISPYAQQCLHLVKPRCQKTAGVVCRPIVDQKGITKECGGEIISTI